MILARSTGLASKVIVFSLSGQKLVVAISSNSVILMAFEVVFVIFIPFVMDILFYEFPGQALSWWEVVDRIKAALGMSEE